VEDGRAKGPEPPYLARTAISDSQMRREASESGTPTHSRIPGDNAYERDFRPYRILSEGGNMNEGSAASKEEGMQAFVGDRVVVHGHRSGEPDRDGKVLEVRGSDGAPPYLVRWEDTGHETIFFPGPDVTIQHFEHHPT
jgi:hypothetical protein